MHVAGLRAAPDTPGFRRYLLSQIRAFAPVYVFVGICNAAQYIRRAPRMMSLHPIDVSLEFICHSLYVDRVVCFDQHLAQT